MDEQHWFIAGPSYWADRCRVCSMWTHDKGFKEAHWNFWTLLRNLFKPGRPVD